MLSQLLYGDYLVFITHTEESGIIGKGKCVKSVAVWRLFSLYHTQGNQE